MTRVKSDDLSGRVALQRAEFEAISELAKQYRRIELTAVVDDDYPEIRHEYETALRAAVEAVLANRGRGFLSGIKMRDSL